MNLFELFFPERASELGVLRSENASLRAVNFVLGQECEGLKIDKESLVLRNDELNQLVEGLKCPIVPVLNGVQSSAIRKLVPKCKYFELLDDVYLVPRLEDVQEFIKWNKVNEEAWVAQENDCNAHAFKFRQSFKEWIPMAPIGIVTMTLAKYRHCANLVCCMSDGKLVLYFIEPLNDGLFKGKYPGMISMELCVV